MKFLAQLLDIDPTAASRFTGSNQARYVEDSGVVASLKWTRKAGLT